MNSYPAGGFYFPEKSSVTGVWQMMNCLPLSDPLESLTRESPSYSLFMRRSFWRPCPLKPAHYLPSNRAELLLIYRIPSHTNPKRLDFSLKHAGQKSVKEELPKQRKAPKRAAEYRLKASTHIWEHDVGCSSHLTPTRKSRCGNPRRDFSMGSCPCSQEGHSSSPGEIRPHLTYPSPETAVRTMRLVWSVL